MKKQMKWTMLGLVVVFVAGMVLAGESKYSAATTATGPSVVFGPRVGQTSVKAIQTSCDVALGAVSIYARGGAGRVPISTTNGATVTVAPVANTSYGLTTNDTVVYVYADGSTPVYRTISAATTTNVTLSSAVTLPVMGDAIYEVTLQSKIVVADNTAAAGTNKLLDLNNVFVSPGDSPLYITMQSATNTCISVTVE